LVVGILAILVVLASDDDEGDGDSDASGAETPTTTVGHVKIHSDPPNAEVFRDGKPLGRTPLQIETEGDDEMALELRAPEHQSVVINLQATPGEVRGVAAVLPPEKPTPEVGPDADVMTVWVESEPSGAAIHKDGRATGYVTPYSLKLAANPNIPIEIAILREGFEDERYTVLPQPGGTIIL